MTPQEWPHPLGWKRWVVCTAGTAGGCFLLDSGLSHLFLAFGWDQRTALSPVLILTALGVYLCLGLLSLPLSLILVRLIPAAEHASRLAPRARPIHPSRWSLVLLLTLLMLGPRLRGFLNLGPFYPALWLGLLACFLGALSLLFQQQTRHPWLSSLERTLLWGWMAFLLIGTKVNVHLLGGSPLLPENQRWNAAMLLSALVLAGGWTYLQERRASRSSIGSSWTRGRFALAAWIVSLSLAWALPTRVSLLPAPPEHAQASAAAPNVLLLVVDTLRADALELQASLPKGVQRTQAQVEVPVLPQTHEALDELFQHAVVFRNHASSSPWTLPGFGTLLTGTSPFWHGAQVLMRAGGQEGKKVVQGVQPLRADALTLAERFQAAGYRTGFIATNPTLDRSLGLADGVEHHELWLRSGLPYIVPAYALEPLGIRPLDPAETSYDAAFMRERFERFMHTQDPRPWLLVAHLMDPHTPYQPPERFLLGQPTPRSELEARAQRYAGEVAYVAEVFRHLYAGLQTPSPSGRRTIIALTSDHGEAFGEHGTWMDPGPLPSTFDPYYARQTLHGQSLYEELLRVPLLLWAPGLKAGTVDAPTRAVDVLPTLLELAGLHADLPLEGRSLLPLAKGEVLPEAPRLGQSLLVGTEKVSLSQGGWKLILKPSWPAEIQEELYDLRADPYEQVNLAQRMPELAKTLRRQLDALRTARDAPPSAVPPPAALEKLRALGYVP